MCLSCHSEKDSALVLEELRDLSKNPHFENWDWNFLSHLTLAFLGMNGDECKKLSKNLFERYMDWKAEILIDAKTSPSYEQVKFLYDNIIDENCFDKPVKEKYLLVWKTAGEERYVPTPSS